LYLAELKAKRAADGYVTSDPAGVMHRKNKRKDASSKGENVVVHAEVDMEQVEVVGDGIAVETAESPKKKKTRTGLAECTRARSTDVSVQVKEKTTEAMTSLMKRWCCPSGIRTSISGGKDFLFF